VGDFGVTRLLEHTQDLAQSTIGTPYYVAPEICLGRPYSYQADIWSLGVVRARCTCHNRG
jgi:NIMA (never in mitosis gene a)-related kinase